MSSLSWFPSPSFLYLPFAFPSCHSFFPFLSHSQSRIRQGYCRPIWKSSIHNQTVFWDAEITWLQVYRAIKESAKLASRYCAIERRRGHLDLRHIRSAFPSTTPSLASAISVQVTAISPLPSPSRSTGTSPRRHHSPMHLHLDFLIYHSGSSSSQRCLRDHSNEGILEGLTSLSRTSLL
ncbi:hypothetical protein SEVIR_9G337150v4 [Setaria viridis]